MTKGEKIVLFGFNLAILFCLYKILFLLGFLSVVKEGQIWVSTEKVGNPFESGKFQTNTVIAVKNGYVQFSSSGTTNVQTKGVFIYNSKKIGETK